jgi:acetyl esterase/lipase
MAFPLRRALSSVAVVMFLHLAACSGLELLNALEPRSFARVERGIAYGPDPRQRLDLYVPPRAASAPVVVFFYGGGWRDGDRGGYAFVGRTLAAAGFIAVIPDYRLHPAVRFPAFVEDAAAAVAWTRASAMRYGGDSARLYVMGHSAGAHSAALLALDSRYLARHGLVSRDLAGIIGLAGPYGLRHEDFPRYRPVFLDAGDAARPARLVRRAPPPLLLMHGEADKSVDIAHSRTLAAAARGAGGRVVLREYENVGHIGLLLALSHRFRGRAPVIDDLAGFAGGSEREFERRLLPAR